MPDHAPYKANITFSRKKKLGKSAPEKNNDGHKRNSRVGERSLLLSSVRHWLGHPPGRHPTPPPGRNSLFTCFYGRHFVTFARAGARSNPYPQGYQHNGRATCASCWYVSVILCLCSRSHCSAEWFQRRMNKYLGVMITYLHNRELWESFELYFEHTFSQRYLLYLHSSIRLYVRKCL